MVGGELEGDQGGEVVVRNDNSPTDISIIYLAGTRLCASFKYALSCIVIDRDYHFCFNGIQQ